MFEVKSSPWQLFRIKVLTAFLLSLLLVIFGIHFAFSLRSLVQTTEVILLVSKSNQLTIVTPGKRGSPGVRNMVHPLFLLFLLLAKLIKSLLVALVSLPQFLNVSLVKCLFLTGFQIQVH